MTLPTIEITQLPGTEDQPMTGANTIVKLNGKEMGCLTSIKVEISARGVAEVTMKTLAHVQFLGVIGKLEQQAHKLEPV